ncbi:MAG: multidrug effflux MFS transporter [Alphaproteobacteria bacterium]
MPRSNKLVIGVLVTLMVAFGPIALDLFLPTLPQLVGAFDTDVPRVQLTLSVYMIGFAISQMIYGPLSDRYGRRPMILTGIAVFGIASLASTGTTTIEHLLFWRFVQALGAASGVVLGRAVVRDVFGRHDSARMLAYVMTAMALAPLLAPILGGVLADAFGWRATFWALLGYAVIAFGAIVWLLPESNKTLSPTASAPRAILATYGTMLRHREYMGYVLTMTLLFSGLFAYISGSSFVLITVMDLTPKAFGLAFGASALGYGAGSQISGRMVHRLGIERLCLWGSVLAALSGITMAVLALAGMATPIAVVAPMVGVMLGIGMASPGAAAGAAGPFPNAAGAAASLLGFIQFSVAAIAGVAVGRWHENSAVPMATIVAIATVGAVVVFLTMVKGRPAVPQRP